MSCQEKPPSSVCQTWPTWDPVIPTQASSVFHGFTAIWLPHGQPPVAVALFAGGRLPVMSLKFLSSRVRNTRPCALSV
jgi:hypothetical protein